MSGTFRWIIGSIVLLAGASIAAASPRIDQLIEQLKGQDEIARSRARQLLPRESIEVVPKLISLLGHEDQKVWRTAFNVLADFANEVSVPGREAERMQVAKDLMSLVGPEQSGHMKEQGLRLLPLVVPDGFDVTPVATLLNDTNWREKARAALEEMQTGEARAAMRDCLTGADADFKCALLDSLGKLRDSASIPTILALTKDKSPKVRAAAARALAWTGDPSHIKPLQGVREAADAETMFEATDALLRLADAIMSAGGNWEAGIAVYREVLATASNPVLQSAAIVGLGNFGDETVVANILAALKGNSNKELEPAALAAFEALQGKAANEALLAAYAQLSDTMRFKSLGIFGRKQNPIFLELLKDALSSDDSQLRQAAMDALAESALPGAEKALEAVAANGDAKNRATALVALKRLVEVVVHKGDRQQAGHVFLSLYRVADSDDLRSFCLEGMKRFPVADALDVVKKIIDDPKHTPTAVAIGAGIFAALRESKKKEESEQVADLLRPHLKTTEMANQVIATANSISTGIELAPLLGMIEKWSVVGPFPWQIEEEFKKTNVNEPDVDLLADYLVRDKKITWQTYRPHEPTGVIRLTELYGNQSNVTAYAYAEIEVPEDTEAVIRMGSDDGIKLWVNSKCVHENNARRGTVLDQDKAPAQLKVGKNSLLVQVTQTGGDWSFVLRITHPDGTPMTFKEINR